MSFFDTPIEFLKGVGPQRAQLLQKELNIFTYGDLLQHYPFRHEDRTKLYSINQVNETMPNIQLKGRITGFEMPGMARKKRLVGYFTDGTGEIELVWFQGINCHPAVRPREHTDRCTGRKRSKRKVCQSSLHAKSENFQIIKKLKGLFTP